MTIPTRPVLLILVICAILIGGTSITSARTDVQLKTGGGEEVDCDTCGADVVGCDECEEVVLTIDQIIVGGCEVSGGMQHLGTCVEEGLERTNINVNINLPYDLYFTKDGGELDCIGVFEAGPDIGWITLSHPGPNMVAKIFKFVELPHGHPDSFAPTAVTVELNQSSFTVLTTATMSVDELNDALESTIAGHFGISDDDEKPYWIVSEETRSGAKITRVSVRADDDGLLTLEVELRPDRESNPAQYDNPCGAPGY